MCLTKYRLKWVEFYFQEFVASFCTVSVDLEGGQNISRQVKTITAVVTATLATFVDVQTSIRLYLYSICYNKDFFTSTLQKPRNGSPNRQQWQEELPFKREKP